MFDKDLLVRTLTVQTTSQYETYMKKFIKSELDKIDGITEIINDTHGNMLVTKGEAEDDYYYPCVAAHMDTVHEIYKGWEVKEADNHLYALAETKEGKKVQVGIGGDDKVGVYIALSMLKKFEAIKVCFFTQEEIGCIGSGKVKLDWFKNVGFIWQADRKGNDEIVCNHSQGSLCSIDFVEKIAPVAKKYGYEFSDRGIWTDVSKLTARNVGVSTNNIGCGYYKAHSSMEVVSVEDVENCQGLFEEVIEMCKGKRWPHSNFEEKPQETIDVKYTIVTNVMTVGKQKAFLKEGFQCPCQLKGTCQKKSSKEIGYFWKCDTCGETVLTEKQLALYLNDQIK